jgi:hypothetical protein
MESGTLNSVRSHGTLKRVNKALLTGISTSSRRMRSPEPSRSLLESMKGLVRGVKQQMASPGKPVNSPKSIKLQV